MTKRSTINRLTVEVYKNVRDLFQSQYKRGKLGLIIRSGKIQHQIDKRSVARIVAGGCLTGLMLGINQPASAGATDNFDQYNYFYDDSLISEIDALKQFIENSPFKEELEQQLFKSGSSFIGTVDLPSVKLKYIVKSVGGKVVVFCLVTATTYSVFKFLRARYFSGGTPPAKIN